MYVYTFEDVNRSCLLIEMSTPSSTSLHAHYRAALLPGARRVRVRSKSGGHNTPAMGRLNSLISWKSRDGRAVQVRVHTFVRAPKRTQESFSSNAGCHTPTSNVDGCNHMTVSLATIFTVKILIASNETSALFPDATCKCGCPFVILNRLIWSHRHFCYLCGENIVQSVQRRVIQAAVEQHFNRCRLFDNPA